MTVDVRTSAASASTVKPTPSNEPLNVDPVLTSIVAENRAVQRLYPPLFTFTPYSSPTSLLPIIATCDLGVLHRHPASEQIYRGKFRKAVLEGYGPMDVYLRQRLGWDEERDGSDTVANGVVGDEVPFTADDEEGLLYKVATNEWPYALPPDVAHICVWTRRPLLHPSFASSPSEWKTVSRLGLAGFSGLPPHLLASLPRSSTAPTSASQAAATCAREIATFVERRWKPEEGYVAAYFVNPPVLQSVKGLSHFHVFVQRSSEV